MVVTKEYSHRIKICKKCTIFPDRVCRSLDKPGIVKMVFVLIRSYGAHRHALSLIANCTWSHIICPSGHLVADLCCYGSAGFLDMFNIETMLSDDFSSILEDIGSKFSVRRYVLPLELDKKVDSVQFIPLNWRCKFFYNLCSLRVRIWSLWRTQVSLQCCRKMAPWSAHMSYCHQCVCCHSI